MRPLCLLSRYVILEMMVEDCLYWSWAADRCMSDHVHLTALSKMKCGPGVLCSIPYDVQIEFSRI